MKSASPVVAAVGSTKIASEHRGCNIRDLMTEAVLDCLADAGLDDLSAVEQGLASYESDHFNVQMTLGAVLHDTIGMIPKPNVRIEGGGATGALALRTAWAYIQSGLCESILVYGCEKNGRGVSSRTANQLFALSADVDWEMMVGGSYTGFYAAMIRAHMERIRHARRALRAGGGAQSAKRGIQPDCPKADGHHHRRCHGFNPDRRTLQAAGLQPAE